MIVDSSPILPVADAQIIAQQVDAVLFSVLADVSRKTKVQAAYQRIATLGVKVLGAVVTGGHDQSSYGNKYYSGYVGNLHSTQLFHRKPRLIANRRHEKHPDDCRRAGSHHRVRAGSWSLDEPLENVPALAELAGRLESVPSVIGDWTATSQPVSSKQMAIAGAVGHLTRVYTNPKNGISVSVMLLCGLPGNISTHTPDICYPGAGYSLGEAQSYLQTYGVPDRTAQFQTSFAGRSGTNPSRLRLYWAWHGSSGWSAPQNARWAFAAEPYLVKLYVVRETGGAATDPGKDPATEFLACCSPNSTGSSRHQACQPVGSRPAPGSDADGLMHGWREGQLSQRTSREDHTCAEDAHDPFSGVAIAVGIIGTRHPA